MNKILIFLSNQDVKEKLDKINNSLKLNFDIDYFEIDFNQEIEEFQKQIIDIDFEEKQYRHILNLSFLDYLKLGESFPNDNFKYFCNVLFFLLPNISTTIGVVENLLGKISITNLQNASLSKSIEEIYNDNQIDNMSILNTNSIYDINAHEIKKNDCNEEYEVISIYDYLSCCLINIKNNKSNTNSFIYGVNTTLPTLDYYLNHHNTTKDLLEQDLIEKQNEQLREIDKDYLSNITVYEVPLFSFSTCLLDQIEN